MSTPREPTHFIKQSALLGIVVGWLTQLGLKTVVPIVVLVAVRTYAQETGNSALWWEYPDDSNHPAWYALQASVLLASVAAGWLAAVLSPRKSFRVPLALVVLSLMATAFEQFPRPLSTLVASVWLAGPCIGLLIGWLLAQWFGRSKA